jgi:signal transduction histidine kinase
LFALFVVDLTTLSSIDSSRAWIAHTREIQNVLSRTRAALVDAETGQRGFLLTGEDDYLDPLRTARQLVPSLVAEAKQMTEGDAPQQAGVMELESLAASKLNELESTVEVYRRGDAAGAVRMVRSDRGKVLMDQIRELVSRMRAQEDAGLEARTAKARRNLDFAIWIDVGAGVGLLLLGFVLFKINRDIARRQELEKALREAARFEQQCMGILSHDLRNPLSAVSMAVALLQRQPGLAPRQLDAVERIGSSAARMARMIDQLLDTTRARIGGGIPVAPKPETNLAEVASGAVEELRAAHPEAELQLDADQNVCGWWDPDRMTQVISNLVSNAIVYGVGPIAVRVKNADASAILEVHNGGPPIPADFLPRIFQAFRRQPASDHAAPSGGLGLGLFIAERIVVAHGGKIDVRSAAAEGTTFRISLPAVAPPPSVNADADRALASPTAG